MKIVWNLIISLFVLVAIIASLSFYFHRYQRNIYSNLLSDINQLNNFSIGRQEPINETCNKVMGYMFESKQGNNYKLVEWCNNGYFVFKNVNLNKNIVTINPLFSTTTFKMSGGTTNLADDNRIMLKGVGA